MESSNNNNVESAALKPFQQRASEAEERLAKLEAAFAKTKVSDSGNEELLNKVAQLERMLDDVKAEQVAERKKALTEISKRDYRILHLVRALEKVDKDLPSKVDKDLPSKVDKDLPSN